MTPSPPAEPAPGGPTHSLPSDRRAPPELPGRPSVADDLASPGVPAAPNRAPHVTAARVRSCCPRVAVRSPAHSLGPPRLHCQGPEPQTAVGRAGLRLPHRLDQFTAHGPGLQGRQTGGLLAGGRFRRPPEVRGPGWVSVTPSAPGPSTDGSAPASRERSSAARNLPCVGGVLPRDGAVSAVGRPPRHPHTRCPPPAPSSHTLPTRSPPAVPHPPARAPATCQHARTAHHSVLLPPAPSTRPAAPLPSSPSTCSPQHPHPPPHLLACPLPNPPPRPLTHRRAPIRQCSIRLPCPRPPPARPAVPQPPRHVPVCPPPRQASLSYTVWEGEKENSVRDSCTEGEGPGAPKVTVSSFLGQGSWQRPHHAPSTAHCSQGPRASGRLAALAPTRHARSWVSLGSQTLTAF